jgi:hypothetical protein
MKGRFEILTLAAGTRPPAGSLVVRFVVFVTVGKSELGSFRSFRVGGRYSASGSTLAAQFFIAATVAKSELGSFRSHHEVGRR